MLFGRQKNADTIPQKVEWLPTIFIGLVVACPLHYVMLWYEIYITLQIYGTKYKLIGSYYKVYNLYISLTKLNTIKGLYPVSERNLKANKCYTHYY